MLNYIPIIFFIFIYFTSCNDNENHQSFFSNDQYVTGEYIYRKSNENFLNLKEPDEMPLPRYIWNEIPNSLPLITKEFFRCKGNDTNKIKSFLINGEEKTFQDCGGSHAHGLPLKDGKEFVYPILIDLLNYLQKRTQKKVIITSGHRCPEHHIYINPENVDSYSKHLIGAEVSFYVLDYETNPLEIISYLMEYYANQPQEFSHFKRYEKENLNLKMKPWLNKEIFIKLLDKNEGRNDDNQHDFPYISIQVRFDKERKENVSYSWEKAYRQYLKK